MMRERNKSATAVRTIRCRFRKARAPATIRPQPPQIVQRERIGPPQAGQRRVRATAGSRVSRFFRSAAWTSYSPSQSGFGHFPRTGISSVQMKSLRQSEQRIFSNASSPVPAAGKRSILITPRSGAENFFAGYRMSAPSLRPDDTRAPAGP